MNTQTRNEEEIAADLFAAKEEEEKAKLKRIELEEELVAVLGKRDEGSKTHHVGEFTVKITGRVSRKIDWATFDELSDKIPPSLWPVKRALDETGVKYLANNEPAIYKILAPALTVETAKTTVSINKGA
jgi:hypothetical protein